MGHPCRLWVQKRRLAVGRLLPVYPQLQTSPCTGLTDAMCHERKSPLHSITSSSRRIPSGSARSAVEFPDYPILHFVCHIDGGRTVPNNLNRTLSAFHDFSL